MHQPRIFSLLGLYYFATHFISGVIVQRFLCLIFPLCPLVNYYPLISSLKLPGLASLFHLPPSSPFFLSFFVQLICKAASQLPSSLFCWPCFSARPRHTPAVPPGSPAAATPTSGASVSGRPAAFPSCGTALTAIVMNAATAQTAPPRAPHATTARPADDPRGAVCDACETRTAPQTGASVWCPG